MNGRVLTLALLGAAGTLLPGHSPYRQWYAYRAKHLIVVTDQARPEARRWMDQLRSAWGGMEMSEDEFIASPHTFIGSLDQLCEKFQMLRERFGISYAMVRPRSRVAFLPVLERLTGT